jgi:hypothetical protein
METKWIKGYCISLLVIWYMALPLNSRREKSSSVCDGSAEGPASSVDLHGSISGPI